MSIANELRGTPRPVRRKLLKKIILILEALLMTAFVMAEEKPMGKFDVWDFELTENEMKKLNALDTGRRYENW